MSAAPDHWHSDDASWQAWNEWLQANGLRNGGSQSPDTVWQAAWNAAKRNEDDLLRERAEETVSALERYGADADHTTLAANLRGAPMTAADPRETKD